jgi:hypothetical protein
MKTNLRKAVDCAVPILLGAVGAGWAFNLMPYTWVPAFAFGGIAGFTACYIINCIKPGK